jgi:hypothetical protein
LYWARVRMNADSPFQMIRVMDLKHAGQIMDTYLFSRWYSMDFYDPKFADSDSWMGRHIAAVRATDDPLDPKIIEIICGGSSGQPA